jgi:prepilin peptidase CpaA
MRMDALAWITIALGILAVFDDLRRRIISNWISGAALTAGLILNYLDQGFYGAAMAAAGAAVGFALLVAFYLMGGLGGGDLKLMAGLGALLGPSSVLTAAVLGAIAGAIMAAVTIVFRRSQRAIPYAPALVLGAWMALVLRN